VTDPPDLLTEPEAALKALEGRFLEACALVRDGRAEEALAAFAAVLRVEPRLAEPRMERARLLLEDGDLEEAEAEVREAIRILEAGGAWLEDPPEEVVLGMAHTLLGEVILRRADTDEFVHGPPARLAALHREAADVFRQAAALDPGNDHARFHAFHLGKRLQ
jgi:tetratricopeptide (TPR) repeat protein